MTPSPDVCVIPAAEIAVIVVNYGTADLAIRAVESVLAAGHRGRGVELHLVDNASPGGDRDILRRAHRAAGWGDRVTLWLEEVNHGFGRGNNLVLRALTARDAPPDKVFLLNPDARLKTEAIAELADFLEAHPRAGAVGSGIDSGPEGQPVTAAFRFPGLISEFTGTAQIGLLSRLLARWDVALPPDTGRGQVDWVAGASVMARLGALEEVGFFDPGFFLYYEETELMQRLRRAGWSVWYLPEARVDHVAGAATGVHHHDTVPKALPGYWFDSWRHYYTRTHGTGYARLCALACLAGAILHGAARGLRGRPSRLPANFRRDFETNVLGPLFFRSRGR